MFTKFKSMGNGAALASFGTTAMPKKTHPERVKKTREDKETSNNLETSSDLLSQYVKMGHAYTTCGKTYKKLKAGVYSILAVDGKMCYLPKSIKSDKWINFRDGMIKEIIDEIDLFWTRTAAFEKYEVLQRRGYLFYGPAGTGKTIITKQIMSKLVSNDGIVFYCDNPSLLSSGISLFREVEPERKITVVFEDIDALIERAGDSDLLSYLDGEDSNNFIVNIATTNYPEKLDRRIVSRPRRFDRLIEVDYPDENMRRFFFEEKLYISKDEKEDVEKWVKATEKFTFAGLTELVISVKCLDIPFETAVKKIRSMLLGKPSAVEYKHDTSGKIGFAGFGEGSDGG